MSTEELAEDARRRWSRRGTSTSPGSCSTTTACPTPGGRGQHRSSCSAGPRPPRPRRSRSRSGTTEDDADRQRARHAAARHDRAHPRRGPQGRRALRLAVPGAASTPTPASTSSSPRAARAAATAATSARSCCGRRWSKAVAPVPVLAAGGIGSGAQIAAALALGCQGAWSGSQWLMVEESENTPVQQDTYVQGRRRATRCGAARSPASRAACCATTGPTRGRRPGSPEPLGMPLQYMVSGMAVAATHRYPDQSVDVAFNPVGPGRRPVREGREDRGGHPALGRGVPRGRRAA